MHFANRYFKLYENQMKTAGFNSLATPCSLEQNKLLKFVFSLSQKRQFQALRKTKFEFMLEILNPFVNEALLKFGSNIDHSKETADFIDNVLTWQNAKTHFKGKWLPDNFLLYSYSIIRDDRDDPNVFVSNDSLASYLEQTDPLEH